jgi:regulator of protease activity HflC (stomatin/prohibitin superfamily)
MNIALIIILVLGASLFDVVLFTVKQQSSVIVERFGKFHSVRQQIKESQVD